MPDKASRNNSMQTLTFDETCVLLGVTAQIGAHERHDGRHRERLRRGEEDHRDGADGHPEVARMPDAAPVVTGARHPFGVVIVRARCGLAHGWGDVASAATAPIRVIASVSTSGPQPKFSRT